MRKKAKMFAWQLRRGAAEGSQVFLSKVNIPVSPGDKIGKILRHENGREYILRVVGEEKMYVPVVFEHSKKLTFTNNPEEAKARVFKKKGKKRKQLKRLRSPYYLATPRQEKLYEKFVFSEEEMIEKSKELDLKYEQFIQFKQKQEKRLKSKTRNTRRISAISADFAIYSEPSVANIDRSAILAHIKALNQQP